MSLVQIEDKHYRKLNELLELCRKNLPRFDETLIRRAFFLCYRAHASERRASGEPYFYHPVEVAKILLTEIPLDDVSVAAALLHDVVEDTDYTIEDVEGEFGGEVANIVAGLTKISDIFKNREIKEAESFRKMLLSMTNDIRVMLVKFSDRLHNMRTLDALPPHRQLKIAIETRDIYAPFAHRFGLGKIKGELEDLAFKYIDREAHDELVAKINLKRTEREQYLEKFIKPIEKELRKRNFKFEVSGRPKHLYSIYAKMRQHEKSLEEVFDLYAIRVIIDTENSSDCFSAYGYITQLCTPIPERFKDYISVPKHNGYQSLHTTVIGQGGQSVEVQIRTRKMHEFAEFGVAAHWKYKERVSSDDQAFESLIKWARELIENTDTPTAFMEGFKMNLYQDEIYVFTPKGDMKVLPKGATPVDFAYEIHTEVGSHCIGAKINGKIIALNSKLKSGDQIEIITSKNQTPKADWEKFVITHKAKLKIKQFVNEDRRRQIDEGRSVWNRIVTRTKKIFTDNDLVKLAKAYGISTPADFFKAIGGGEVNAEHALTSFEEKEKQKQADKIEKEGKGDTAKTKEEQVVSFVKTARQARTDEKSSSPVVIAGMKGIAYSYAKCCNPVPGDDVIGLVTAAGEVRVHRKSCRNITNETLVQSEKILAVEWTQTETNEFITGLRIFGEDKLGMSSAITNVISKSDTNIRSIALSAKDGIFEGTVIVYVRDLPHLQRLVEKLKRIDGVFTVERFLE